MNYLNLTNLLFLLVLRSEDLHRAELVKQSFLHAWNGYKKYAFTSDEIRPISNKTVNNRFQGWGVTMVDSLSTLWMMDLKEEFSLVVEALKKVDFTKTNGNKVLVFETCIRYLGGLISGYDLSNEQILLDKAIQLADKLIYAFNSPSGIPYPTLDFRTNSPPYDDGSQTINIAEAGTLQLEFTRLTQITKNTTYQEKALRVFDLLDKLRKPKPGLYPIYLNTKTGAFVSDSPITFGAMGDSFYEYLLKTYLITRNERYLLMFEESMRGLQSLLGSTKSGDVYLNEMDENLNKIPKMDHLSFFVPAMLALGSYKTNNQGYLNIAKQLTNTFYKIYNSTKTNLGPEITNFNKNKFYITHKSNYLRPEYLESLFYLNKFTKDKEYEDMAYRVYLALNQYSRTPTAFANYDNVDDVDTGRNQVDVLESFVFAETFKYLYLVYKPYDFVDLNKWVFNTEGHPFKIVSN